VPPIMVKTPANPDGLPIDVFDQIRTGLINDRSQFFKDFAIPFYGANRPNDICYYPRSNTISWRGVGLVARLEPLSYENIEPEE